MAFVDVPTVLKQADRPDALTHPSRRLHLARNYVTTMEGALARDAERIRLDRAVVREARAYGHAWTGLGYLESGDAPAARRHLRRSLRLKARQPRTIALVLLALLPGPQVARAIHSVRRARARWRTR